MKSASTVAYIPIDDMTSGKARYNRSIHLAICNDKLTMNLPKRLSCELTILNTSTNITRVGSM
jgi:hypothetical protein